MPTTVTSTISLSGSPDYSTLQAWEDASPANLVTADQIWRGEIQEVNDNFSGATNVLILTGSTSDATRYKELTTAAAASFRDDVDNLLTYDESQGCSIVCTGSENSVIVSENFVRISNIQMSYDGTTLGPIQITTSCLLENLILRLGTGTGSEVTITGSARFVNCVLTSRVSTAARLMVVTSGSSNFHNCTFVTPSDLTAATHVFVDVGGTVTANNCAFFGVANVAFSAGSFTTCYTDDSTPPSGCTTIAYDTTTGSGFEGITVAAQDLRIKSTSSLIDVGTDDATYASEDIFGNTRPSSEYDVGVHEFPAVAGGIINMLLLGVG